MILYRQTFEEHILPSRPELKRHVPLIKSIVEQDSSDVIVSQKISNPDRIAIQKKCPHFMPYNRYLRVALRLLNNKELAVITTVVPVDNVQSAGVKKYERK